MTKKPKTAKTASKKLSPKQLVDAAKDKGALGAKAISPADVATAEWVRWKCQFGCGGYGTSLNCPPNTPTPERTRTMLDGYSQAILFESPPGEAKRIAVELERELFLAGYYKAFGLGAGRCRLCDECSVDEGCRHPREARPSLESCGIDVYATARAQGFTIEAVRTRDDPQHYYGLVLVQ